MNFTRNETKAKEAVVRLALSALLVIGVAGPANAQITSEMGTLSQLSPEADALLPPEVVPFEAQPATRLPEAPAVNGQTLGNPMVSQFASGQAARELRQQAFGSLMNRDELWQHASEQYNRQLAAQQAQQQQLQMQALQNNHIANSLPAQSQMLSGGPRIVPTQGITRTPFTHATSGAVLLGSSLFTATRARSNPAALYSLGLLGVGMGNYVFRNGFRF